jgi:hypothetical protein
VTAAGVTSGAAGADVVSGTAAGADVVSGERGGAADWRRVGLVVCSEL